MRKPKYIGMQSGDWTCVFYGIDYLQPAFRKKRDVWGNRVRNKSAGHRQYYYIFKRRTSDHLADKFVRLNAAEILKVSRGKCTVEDLAEKKHRMNSPKYRDKVSYCFCS